ncbi:hypothetical protein EMIHUDRAFT_122105, partial [Emiliania huxleyi CCMP1516]|uniref:RNA-binding protein Tab2/Atab2 C-terminal domain-containing protein n=2 Tax=Emiliania huxleyi TaxID=2903 RepID=A0A0D3KTM2_EMIH1
SLYPTMAGYRPPRPEPPPVRLPVKLPDQLRGEQYAFVTLPYAEFLPGGGITDENVGFGSLCPLPAADRAPAEDAMVPGLVVFSRRAPAIAAWLTGADPRGRRRSRVRASAEADAPDGFWLLKDVAAEKRAVFSPPA